MPLPTFDKQDDIPEAVRGGYVQKGAKWVPEIDDSALRTNYQKALDEKKQLDASLTAALKGRKLEDVASIIDAHAAAEEERQKKAGDFDKLLEKRVNETKAEYEKRVAALEGYKQKYEDRELEAAIRDAAAKAGVIPEDMKMVLAIVKGARVRLDEKTGKPVVVDTDGDVTGMTVEKFFAESFKAEAPKFYQAAGGSGGGATGGSGNRNPSTGAVASDIQDFVSRITTDKNALQQAKTGQLTVRG